MYSNSKIFYFSGVFTWKYFHFIPHFNPKASNFPSYALAFNILCDWNFTVILHVFVCVCVFVCQCINEKKKQIHKRKNKICKVD